MSRPHPHHPGAPAGAAFLAGVLPSDRTAAPILALPHGSTTRSRESFCWCCVLLIDCVTQVRKKKGYTEAHSMGGGAAPPGAVKAWSSGRRAGAGVRMHWRGINRPPEFVFRDCTLAGELRDRGTASCCPASRTQGPCGRQRPGAVPQASAPPSGWRPEPRRGPRPPAAGATRWLCGGLAGPCGWQTTRPSAPPRRTAISCPWRASTRQTSGRAAPAARACQCWGRTAAGARGRVRGAPPGGRRRT